MTDINKIARSYIDLWNDGRQAVAAKSSARTGPATPAMSIP